MVENFLIFIFYGFIFMTPLISVYGNQRRRMSVEPVVVALSVVSCTA